ncbi:MAG TPA: hypothetical protein VGS11_01635 [Candidatus Bathyarchaeia archaeon]|nr:hypothetical protein [Candidatus Bathyarchaeia archaeon]
MANKSIVAIAIVGGVLIICALFLFATFFSGGGNQGQYWNWGWTLLIPGSALCILAAVLYRSYGGD